MPSSTDTGNCHPLDLDCLDDLKREDKLVPFACLLLMIEKDVGEEKKLLLERLFRKSLASNASLRALSIRGLIDLSEFYQ